MPDNYTVLNPGVGGDTMDESAITYGGPPLIRKRPRVVIGGDANGGGLIEPLNVPPAGGEYAIPVRNIPTGTVQPVAEATTTTPGPTAVPAAVANTVLLAANTLRKGATIYNDSSSVLRVAFTTAAAVGSFSVKVLPGGYYEVPFRNVDLINGIWEAATGNAMVTEFV